MSPRLRLSAGLVALLAAAAAACSGGASDSASGSSSVPAAEAKVDTSRLVVYSGRQEQLVGDLFEKFEKKSGVDVSVRYGESAELAAQLLEEGDRTAADVFFSQDAGALGALSTEGRFSVLPAATTEKVNRAFRAKDGRWVGTSGRARVVVYNPGKVATPPATIDEVVTNRFKGKVGVAPTNASFQAFVTGMRVRRGEAKTRKWLEQLKGNDVREFPNNLAILDAVERGEIELGLINHYYWFEKQHEVGKGKLKSKLAFLGSDDPGALVNVAGAGILAGTDRSKQAQQLVDYLLSEEAQRYMAETTFEYPVAADVPAAAGLPALDSLRSPAVDLSELRSLSTTLDLLESVGLT